jgi:hypothetical protein
MCREGEEIELEAKEGKSSENEDEQSVHASAEERKLEASSAQSKDINEAQKGLDRTSTSVDYQIQAETWVDNDDGKRSSPGTYPAENGDLAQSVRRAEGEHQNIGEARRKGRLFVRFKFIAWALALTVSTTSLAIAVFALATRQQGRGDPPGLSDEDKARIKRLVEEWRNLSDSECWDSMAKFVDTWRPSLQAQMLFMEYMKQFSESASWPSGSGDAVNTLKVMLEDAFTSSTTALAERTTAMIYREVATQTFAFDPAHPNTLTPVPRYLAADLCDLALADIINYLRLQNPGGARGLGERPSRDPPMPSSAGNGACGPASRRASSSRRAVSAARTCFS